MEGLEMFKSACDTMKKSIITASLLLVFGTIIGLSGLLFSLESVYPVLIIYAGLFAISLGVLILLITLLAVMIPSVNQRLDACQH
jgi:hypothetical protein